MKKNRGTRQRLDHKGLLKDCERREGFSLDSHHIERPDLRKHRRNYLDRARLFCRDAYSRVGRGAAQAQEREGTVPLDVSDTGSDAVDLSDDQNGDGETNGDAVEVAPMPERKYLTWDIGQCAKLCRCRDRRSRGGRQERALTSKRPNRVFLCQAWANVGDALLCEPRHVEDGAWTLV